MPEEPTAKDLQCLLDIKNGQLLGSGAATALTDGMKSSLLELGVIEENLDGHAITARGKQALPK